MFSLTTKEMFVLSLSTLVLLNLPCLTITSESESFEDTPELDPSEINNSNNYNENVNNNAIRLVKGQISQGTVVPVTGVQSSSENRVKYHNHHRNGDTVPLQSQETNSNNNAFNRRTQTSSNNNNNKNSYNNPQTNPDGESQSATKCLTCQNQEFESSLPERTMRALRIEMVKQQILRKLRLKEPPKSEGVPKDQTPLPSPIASGDTLPKRKSRGSEYYYSSNDKDLEDFYGKTEQVIVLPDTLIPGCLTSANSRDYPAACFVFNLPKEIRTEQISSAELWAFKLPDPNDSERNQTFWLSELLNGTGMGGSSDPLESSSRAKVVDIKTNVRHRQDYGWLSFKITKAALRWLGSKSFSQTLQVGCKSCGMNAKESPIGSMNEGRPFMVFNIASVSTKRRKRRQNCSPGATECCRERFVIDFHEIGWDWVISPPGFEAYYCKGSCMGANALSLSMNSRTSMVQTHLGFHGVNNRTAELVPCCTAHKMSSISMAYRDPSAMNSDVKVETLPNMVIESCGCL